MRIAFLNKARLLCGNQRVRILILRSIGIPLIFLTLLFVLPFLLLGTRIWPGAQYAGGRVINNTNLPSGLHMMSTTLGSSVSYKGAYLKLGTNVWAVRVIAPIP